MNKIGSLLQTLTQLDYQAPEEVSSSSSSSNGLPTDKNGGKNQMNQHFSMIRSRSTSEQGREVRQILSSLATAIHERSSQASILNNSQLDAKR